MPLVKGRSDAAHSANVATEIRAGKSPAQANAIAYAVQRKARAEDSKHAADFKGALDSLNSIADRCMSPTAPKKPKESQ